MGFALAPSAAATGYRLEVFETIDSTNALAMRRAREGDLGQLWVVSPHQQAGRGRRGREWQTAPGNLAATLLLKPEVEMRVAATLGFVAGLALVTALEAVLPRDIGRIELKWPNDVLLDGAKLSGILLESTVLGNGGYALAVGIGVNVVHHPVGLPYPAIDLKTLGSRVDAATLFLAISDAWIDKANLWQGGRGLSGIRNEWLARAAGRGREMVVHAEGEVVRGIFETIDEECRFVIRDADGSERRIAVGDVYFGATASAASA